MQTRTETDLFGIDISHYEFEGGNSLNFDDAVAKGVKVVITKATDGSYGDAIHDPTLGMVTDECHKRNLAISPFHFFRVWKNSTVQAQVDNFLGYIKGLTFNAMPVIDVEPESICDGADYATVVAQANEWVDKVQSALGVPVLVYINTNLLLNLPAGIHGAGYWIADYRYGNVPGENGKTESWIGFQYGDNGQFAGESATDVDAFRPEVIIPAWSYGATPTPAPAPQPTPAPAPAPAPVGDPAVKAYQDKLNRLGFNCGAADGLNGPHTQGAVVQMEQVLGLSVDEGIWGGECESAYEQITSKPYLQEGANGLAVRYLQFRSGAGIDGIWGQETSGCIRNMQSSIGCYPDGIVGDDTWNHLIG